MSEEEPIEEVWGRGRAALDAAAVKLQRARDSAPLDLEVAIESLRQGALSAAMESLAELSCARIISAELAIAVDARDRVITRIRRVYGAEFERMAYSFRHVTDATDAINQAWEQITRKLYSWRRKGELHAWLRSVFRRSLLDGLRASRRRTAKLTRYADEVDLHRQEPDIIGKGSTTYGTELALEAFKDSLDSEKRSLWDGWAQLGAEGMKPEQIYVELAKQYGKTPVAIKGTILRLVAEFKDMVGTNAIGVVDASEIVAFWVGSERDGERAAILATGIDMSDRVRLLAMRQVRVVNRSVFERLFSTLNRWGIPEDRRLLVVLDESQGLRDVVEATFRNSLVQPCIHAFLSAVVEPLPPQEGAHFRSRALKAYQVRQASQAYEQLHRLGVELEGSYPSAARRFLAGIEESLTVKRLGLPASLEEQLTRVQFVGNADPAVSWLARVFTSLRGRRSVERRREGLKLLCDHLRE